MANQFSMAAVTRFSPWPDQGITTARLPSSGGCTGREKPVTSNVALANGVPVNWRMTRPPYSLDTMQRLRTPAGVMQAGDSFVRPSTRNGKTFLS